MNQYVDLILIFLGRTPLHIACNTGQFECAKVLVSSGCKITIHDLLGRLPIVEAARLREAAMLNLLLKASGPSYAPDFLGKYQLSLCTIICLLNLSST